ncbi:transmembrane protein [Rhynchospora pubera]|uniref:Transmembrane protein n=1 Tax=Rhynchospora pubera TaxID=906938 RepID=A0AAV8HN32_9POAL|nr:transmembrane protein [Rhynchospora pubera]
MESASLALSVPRLQKSHLLRSGAHTLTLNGGTRSVRGRTKTLAIEGAATEPVQITWQITVGALAGVTPFVVAGIEFGKRIIAQQKCEVCGGSGLVLKNKIYVRCQGCGNISFSSPFLFEFNLL